MISSVWDILIPVITVMVLALGIYLTNTSKFYTVREHEAFEQRAVNMHEILRAQVQREMDQVHMRLSVLEATRPTTGELQARIDPRPSTPLK